MARLQQKKQAAVTTGSAGSTGIPRAMVLTAYIALSPGTGLFCPRHFRRKLLPCENLAPASGRQDHTILPSASGSPVKRAAASTASRPTSVTFAKRPSGGAGRLRTYG